jgi:hypothetical protein
MFDLEQMPDVQMFDSADAAMSTAPDLNPAAATLQAKVRAVSAEEKTFNGNPRVNRILYDQTRPEFAESGGDQWSRHASRRLVAASYGPELMAAII